MHAVTCSRGMTGTASRECSQPPTVRYVMARPAHVRPNSVHATRCARTASRESVVVGVSIWGLKQTLARRSKLRASKKPCSRALFSHISTTLRVAITPIAVPRRNARVALSGCRRTCHKDASRQLCRRHCGGKARKKVSTHRYQASYGCRKPRERRKANSPPVFG